MRTLFDQRSDTVDVARDLPEFRPDSHTMAVDVRRAAFARSITNQSSADLAAALRRKTCSSQCFRNSVPT